MNSSDELEQKEKARIEAERRAQRRVVLASRGGAVAALMAVHDTPPASEAEWVKLMSLRRQAFRALTKPLVEAYPELARFDAEMTERHGKWALAHNNIVTWPEAFMVGRYGEAVDFWPDALTADDLRRIERWDVLGFPEGIKPLHKDKDKAKDILMSHMEKGFRALGIEQLLEG